MIRWFCCLLVVCETLPVLAQAEEKKESKLLTLNAIFTEGEYNAKSFSATWLVDGSGYATWEKSEQPGGGKDLVRYDPATGKKDVLIPASRLVPAESETPLNVQGVTFSKDFSKALIYTNSKRVWRRNTRGDYWVYDLTSYELEQLGGDAKASTLMFAEFSPDGEHVCYVRENNLYVESLADHQITPLTNSGSKQIINGTFDWVYEEELSLRKGFRWSPDSKSVSFWQLDTEGVREFTLVDYTTGLYPEFQTFGYPKVGEQNPAARIGLVSIETPIVKWLDIPGDPRNHYLARMDWTPDAKGILIQQLNRLQNTNTVFHYQQESRTAKKLFADQDKAWVEITDEIHWVKENETFLWLSERDGWQHLYQVSLSDGKLKLLTPGEYDVIEIERMDRERNQVYFIASPENPTQRALYRIELEEPHNLQRVTPADQGGIHSYNVSQDGDWAIHSWSTITQPTISELITLPDHKTKTVLEDNKELNEKLANLSQPTAEMFRVEIEDGVELDAWVIKPPDFDPKKKYPLLVYVYGEPAGQTVLDRWGGKGQLWHWMLAQQGYLVMSFDNRGTPAPRGREWRKCVYRQVGILAPKDQAAAVRKVIDTFPGIDADRIGVWGWSGGGSMTLNAMFKFPDLYHTGICIAPVPNQRFYDTIYQERYMGLPKDNVKGFREGSPINYAHQLQGNLLLIHGTGDDNCHYQGTEMLINELIQHNKLFSMMAYPNRGHSVSEGANTSRHLRETMTNYLHQHLPAGGK